MKVDDPRHGTYNGYNNQKCRCPECKKANADRQREYLATNPAQKAKAVERDRQREYRDRRAKYAEHRAERRLDWKDRKTPQVLPQK